MKYLIRLINLFLISLLPMLSSSYVRQCVVDTRNIRAVEYVGTRSTGGLVQLKLLQKEGLQEHHYVLEIGSGALMSAIPIMSYLEKGHYVGIEPNTWLMDQTLLIVENKQVMQEKNPIFLTNMDFDASSSSIAFDYVYAHSIMSHAAHWQLSLFFEKTSKVLKPNGKLIFSMRLTEPNQYGGEGAPHETHAEEWVYPGCSFFDKSTVINEASKWFKTVELNKDFTAMLTADSPGVCHDWFVLTK